ncbi:thermonuclease family protein [Niabella yanshanensis]|uniref:Thermonuclease family protein n=1 Tax=Niabella yanshanensis TaxID=577386 RepID=A0ABZ0W4P1_9BACT|nr:thermonuclease family protein [Niabella yanshanensis]WQD38225.1 thermonuclease family protein [Niabella yanshanensis]
MKGSWYISCLQIASFFTSLLLDCAHSEEKLYENIYTDTAAPFIHSSVASSPHKVIGIKDGDTFVVLINGKEQVVRLAHIDCPEKKQPFGAKAKEFVSQQSFGMQVSLVHGYKYDRNRRLIAEVILADGRNLNKELVKNGLAWHFKKYSDDTTYAVLENKARKARVGVWGDHNPIAPWEWRRSKHTANTAR